MNRLQKFIYITAFLFSISIVAEEKVKTCIEGDCQNGKGKVQTEEGNIFESTFKNGKLNGLVKGYRPDEPDKISTMYFIDGKIDVTKKVSDWFEDGEHYEGYFNSDMNMHGKGKLTYIAGETTCVFEGSFLNGKKHGIGKISCEDGTKVAGEWRNDRRYFPIELDFICRSLERVDKWEGGAVSGKFKFKMMRNSEELETSLREWSGIELTNWNEYTIAEGVYKVDSFETIFFLFIPTDKEKEFDELVSKKRDLNINGIALGTIKMTNKYPAILVEKIK
ncbi:hypothetical protein JWG45_14505 [Leptospira sp. 201903070]|uniref:MORN repeat protein n=1 Tax=Leptospira ainlahdjerensis TaxID=2810033 RepID=A0ABS2UHK4_9LEPT|nr:hypothetical protein [Leptospira ainlahdjerensis]MBM9578360.1 hypothetical protein [Leptospira ainlahdjerensis]